MAAGGEKGRRRRPGSDRGEHHDKERSGGFRARARAARSQSRSERCGDEKRAGKERACCVQWRRSCVRRGLRRRLEARRGFRRSGGRAGGGGERLRRRGAGGGEFHGGGDAGFVVLKVWAGVRVVLVAAGFAACGIAGGRGGIAGGQAGVEARAVYNSGGEAVCGWFEEAVGSAAGFSEVGRAGGGGGERLRRRGAGGGEFHGGGDAGFVVLRCGRACGWYWSAGFAACGLRASRRELRAGRRAVEARAVYIGS
eukprot:XP_020393868.1 glycine-rich cell wall structural protein-like [Zea mays]